MQKRYLLKLFQESEEGGEMKESSGGGEFKYDIFDTLLRTSVNTPMYLHPAQQ
jgi:hypothetical protein